MCVRGERLKAEMFEEIFLLFKVCNGLRCRGGKRQTGGKLSMLEGGKRIALLHTD